MSTLNITRLVSGASVTKAALQAALTQIQTWFNGNIDNTNIASTPKIANSKLANPNAYYPISFQFAASASATWKIKMPPHGVTVDKVYVYARTVGAGAATLGVQEAGVSILSASITLAAADTNYEGTVSDNAIAADADVSLVFTFDAGDDYDVVVNLILKLNHVA